MESNTYSELFNIQKEYFHSVLKKERIYARKERLIKIQKWVKKNKQEIQDALYNDFQKSPEEVLISEIKPVIGEISQALKQIRSWSKEKKVPTPISLLGTKAKIVKEAKGVCLVIAPWNFPFMLAIGPVISAIAAGNTVVLKPSEMTPHTEKLINRLIKELFLEANIAVVTGGVKETQALLALPWNHIFFTGSPQVGKIVMEKASKHLTSVTLELGGRNPVIVTKNTNLTSTAKKLIWGKFFNNGQSCVSPNYLLVDERIKKQLIEELKFEFVAAFGNYPEEIKKNKSLARVVNNHHFKRVNQLLQKSINEGAKVVFGNNTDNETNYISPTLLDEVTTKNSIFSEEIFGPILPIISYKTIDEVIEIINKVEPALALYIFSTSNKVQNQIIQNTSAGTTVINDTTIQFAHPNLPFGGVGLSGMGKAHGYYGFLEFTNQRSVLKQRNRFTTSKLIYPKYNAFKKMIIKLITWNDI
jgi:aldehyde dehydrogenase (NAD+)